MHIEISQILFQIINFSVVAGALTYLLYKPVRQMLADRSKKIEAGQLAAEEAIAEKHNMDDMKKKVLKQAEKEAATILEEAKKDAKKLQKQLMDEAKLAAQKETEKEMTAAQEEAKSLAKKLKTDFANQVFAVTEEILGESIDRKALEKNLDKTVSFVVEKI